jgi:hypothetical protein
MTDKPPVACIIWEDANDPDGASVWVDNKDHKYTQKIFVTVGFLLHDGPDGLTLTSSWSDDLISGRQCIPRGMVHSVTLLEPVKSKRTKR